MLRHFDITYNISKILKHCLRGIINLKIYSVHSYNMIIINFIDIILRNKTGYVVLLNVVNSDMITIWHIYYVSREVRLHCYLSINDYFRNVVRNII